MSDAKFPNSCPIPFSGGDIIVSAHGGGGRMTRKLIEEIFAPAFDNPLLRQLHDGAVFEGAGDRFAFATDSYVVQPLFFPGGDIGKLAVCGTVNDLAMCGARALYLSAGFILEEGLPIEQLKSIVNSMSRQASEAEVAIVTGDTKVVERRRGDGMFINTAGIGVVPEGVRISADRIERGDIVLLSGDVGRHGIAILAARGNLQMDMPVASDCAPLWRSVNSLIAGGIDVHFLRDLTRGGLATALIETAASARMDVSIAEAAIPLLEVVRGACELLGFDPLYLANEGRFIAIVRPEQADQALDSLRRIAGGVEPAIIGEVTGGEAGRLWLRSCIGIDRPLELLSGEQLPRIC